MFIEKTCTKMGKIARPVFEMLLKQRGFREKPSSRAAQQGEYYSSRSPRRAARRRDPPQARDRIMRCYPEPDELPQKQSL